MSVRKGKRLIARLLPLLPSPQAVAVVMAIARNLPALAKKDKQDQVTNQPAAVKPPTRNEVLPQLASSNGMFWAPVRVRIDDLNRSEAETVPAPGSSLWDVTEQGFTLCCLCVQVLCWLVEPVSAVIQSLSSSALTDLLQELQGNEGQLATALQNKVCECSLTPRRRRHDHIGSRRSASRLAAFQLLTFDGPVKIIEFSAQPIHQPEK